MMSEGRTTVREPHDLRVQIHYHGRHFRAARGRSLSRSGMYLDLRNVTLPVGTLLELELEGAGEPRRVEAVVIHGSPTGVGVRFAEEQPGLGAGVDPREPDPGSTGTEPPMPPPLAARAAPPGGAAMARPHD